jgi:hypothetical protein
MSVVEILGALVLIVLVIAFVPPIRPWPDPQGGERRRARRQGPL